MVKETLTLPKKPKTRLTGVDPPGITSQLNKSGSTNKTSGQRQVVLLNSGYQLLNYIINERL